MKKILVYILIISLLGLAYVQYRLLITGLQLEKTRLDRQVEFALDEVARQLYEPSELAEEIVQISAKSLRFQTINNDSMKAETLRKVEVLLQESLQKYGATVDFTFAIDADNLGLRFLKSEDYELPEERYLRYQKRLSGAVLNGCNCPLILRVNTQHLIGYLLRQLNTLLLPLILFLSTIGICFLLLNRMLNKQRELAEVKNDFINNLTHELKTPVFSIGLITKLLRERISVLEDEKAIEYVQLIQRENEQMKRHVEQVLELASLENGHYILEQKEVEIHDFLRTISTDYLPKINTQNGTLITHFSDKKMLVDLDENHFKNAIENLLDNALKYRSKAAPNIKISTQIEDSKLVISIKDNGKGIASEHQKTIFQKFYRVPNGDVHDVKGFGLGLSYVQQVISLHGGKIRVESEEGKGATFYISLNTLNQK